MMVPGSPVGTDYTNEILALRNAIASGTTHVSYDGKSVDYDDLEGMKRRLALVTGWQAQNVVPGYRRPQAGFATFTRGNG